MRANASATPSSTWMNPPRVLEVTIPSTQSEAKMMAVVHNMMSPLSGAFVGWRCSFGPTARQEAGRPGAPKWRRPDPLHRAGHCPRTE